MRYRVLLALSCVSAIGLGCPSSEQDSAMDGEVSSGSGVDSGTDSNGSTPGATTGDSGPGAEGDGASGEAGDTASTTDAGSEGTDGDGSGDADGSTGTGGMDGVVDPGFPVDCEMFSVWVENGGGYDSVQDGVAGTPPGGSVYICPGTYAENILVQHNMSILGAGRDLVTIEGLPEGPTFTHSTPGLTDITIRDLTVSGGLRGVSFNMNPSDDGVSHAELSRIRVTGAALSGIRLGGTSGAEASIHAELLDVTVDNTVSEDDGAGIQLTWLMANLVDCVIEDNTTTEDGGGLWIWGANVSMTGGAVRRNTADRGGGAYVRDEASTLEIIDVDWGTGQDQENEDEDVRCEGSVSGQAYLSAPTTWLGSPAAASCSWNGQGMDCCSPL